MIARQGGNVVAAGRLTRDPEFKMVGKDGNKPLCKLGVAVADKTFLNVTCWHPHAEYAEGLEKGDFVIVLGHEETGEYNGQPKVNTIADFIMKQPDAISQMPELTETDRHDTGSAPQGNQGPSEDCPF